MSCVKLTEIYNALQLKVLLNIIIFNPLEEVVVPSPHPSAVLTI